MQKLPVLSKKYASPLQLELYSSRLLFIALVFSHLLAIVALYFVALPLIALLALAMFALFSAVRAIVLHALRKSANAVVKLVWDDNDCWYIVRRSGIKQQVQLQRDSFVSPWLTVLRFKVPGQWLSQAVILLGDNSHIDSHRRLRVRLKTTAQTLFD